MTYRHGPSDQYQERSRFTYPNRKRSLRDNGAVSRLEEAWNENPLLVIGVAAGLMMAASKLIDSVSGIRSRQAYARRMNRS